jgi:hypothetical protein
LTYRNACCEYQAPSSLLEALEGHLASLEGRKPGSGGTTPTGNTRSVPSTPPFCHIFLISFSCPIHSSFSAYSLLSPFGVLLSIHVFPHPYIFYHTLLWIPHHLDPDPAFHFDADPDPDPAFHFDADPDPTFHSDADPDPTFQFDADPDPTTNIFQDLDPPVLQNVTL